MTLGGYGGIALAVAVIVVGILITCVQVQTAIAEGHVTWSEWSLILLGTMPSWMGLLLFTSLLILGLVYRTQPEAHKRYVVFATIMLVVAATSRMDYLLGEWDNTIGIGLMVAPLLAYDLYADGRVHPATLIGTGAAEVYLGVELL